MFNQTPLASSLTAGTCKCNSTGKNEGFLTVITKSALSFFLYPPERSLQDIPQFAFPQDPELASNIHVHVHVQTKAQEYTHV